ncbi:hypothetical protein [Deinococcus sp. AJ005]|uniref:hypothetical protein n=1 Tax=Deinococcus sp. AJ005 TaxID=2652443 RepID=UPI00125CB1E7|nr:hypothetical protein [Deinococcus sp. AJ005]QFP76215.1 hypothetical protein DAAJ005_06935 [Deinococcus sp. AJ005]
MRAKFFCPKCFEEFGGPKQDNTLSVAINDMGTESDLAICSRGHTVVVLSSSFNYQLTLSYAFLAFEKGFYREATIDAQAALENMYGEVIRAYGLKRQFTDAGVKFSINIKSISKLSERRIGAFVLICALEGVSPFILPEKFIKIRNNCVHNGINPGKDRAFEFIKECAILMCRIKDSNLGKDLDLMKDIKVGSRFRDLNGNKSNILTYILHDILDDRFMDYVIGAFGTLEEYLQIDNEHLWDNVRMVWDDGLIDR